MAASTSNAYPPSTFVVSDHVYPAAKERLPDRFALTKLGEIFSSWAETPEAKRLTSTETNGKQTIYFVHEQLKYESKVWTHLESYKGVPQRTLKIRLLNDGFLCKRDQELRGLHVEVKRPR